MKRALLIMTTVAAALALSVGVAFAQDIVCPQEGGFSCEGTPEADLITGSEFADDIYARGAADVVYARAGDDNLYGGPRRDRLYGQGGTDDLFGGTGADTLNEGDNPASGFSAGMCGGRGDDRLNGGPGPDRYQFGYLWGKDTIVGEGENAPDESDILDFNMYAGQLACAELNGLTDAPLTIDMPAGRAYVTSAGPSGTNTVDFVGTHIESVHGGINDDTITGGGSPNGISGEAGDDTINAGRGNDRVVENDPYFEHGDDTINAGRGDDLVVTNHPPYLDHDSDTVDCGPGRDTAIVDDNDTTKNCESVTVDNEFQG